MNVLTLKDISFHPASLEKPILQDINLTAVKGDFIIILGMNGSGKSSLLKLLDRRYIPTTGNIFLEDKALYQMGNQYFHQTVVTLTQSYDDSLFTSLTVLENFSLAKERYQLQFSDDKTFFANYIKPYNLNLAHKGEQIVSTLSGGEKQTLALAFSLLSAPKILLLDEFTSALDPKTGKRLMAITAQMVQKHNITCFLATHDLEMALAYGHRIIALRQGKIIKTFNALEKAKLNYKTLLTTCYD